MEWPTQALAFLWLVALVSIAAAARAISKARRVATATASLRAAEDALRLRERHLDQQLELVAGLSAEEAKQRLEGQTRRRGETHVRQTLAAAERSASQLVERRARELMVGALARISSEPGALPYTAIVPVPDDPPRIGSRIIGPRGRNAKVFERVTGVELNHDQDVSFVMLTALDSERRHVAEQVLRLLIEDGRIFPETIQATHAEVLADWPSQLRRLGEEAGEKAGVTALPSELALHMGRLSFITTGGRSLLDRAVVGAQIADALARELGIDPEVPRRAAYLRDLGTGLGLCVAGEHAAAGASLAGDAGESHEVCEAIASHHRRPFAGSASLASALVHIADNVVTRYMSVPRYQPTEVAGVRWSEVEALCRRIGGVAQAHVVRLGEEIHIVVDPQAVGDDALDALAVRVREQIHDAVGLSTNVVVLRQTRAVAGLVAEGGSAARAVCL